MLQPLNHDWATASTYPTLLLKVVIGELLRKINDYETDLFGPMVLLHARESAATSSFDESWR